jgi:FkbH-like protein
VLASHTVEHLLPGIRVAGLRRRIFIETHVCAYGQYRQELSDPDSLLHAFAPHFVLFALAAQELLQSGSAAQGFVAELRGLWKTAQQVCQATVIQQTFIDVSEPLFGNFDRLVELSPAHILDQLNQCVVAAAREDGALLLDIERQAAREGRDNWFEVAHWYASKLTIAPRAAPLFGDLLARVMAARLGQSKKCLVLDLDNTIWGGVVGDDGVHGLVLGQGSAQGEAHLALQRYARQLRERGIILAVCSKNERAIAEEAFKTHPEMLLKLSDIAAFYANWADKAENLRAIAAQLNIGIDSLVFVDDNPAERERIRGALPQVAVPELPEDVAGYVRAVADAGYFEAAGFTDEDRARGEQYAANNEREVLKGSTQSIEEFRRSLGMTMSFGPVTPVDLARVGQLINKTNQFNVTMRRYSQQEIESILQDTGNLALQFRLGDRFGDNGLISAVILRPAGGPNLALETWVMSCRVFGREVEFEIMNAAVDAARARGFEAIDATYVPTPKNGLIRELLPKLGFAEASDDDASRWTLDLRRYIRQTTHIQPQAQQP